MKSIDEYKKELLLRVMNGERFSWKFVSDLPKDDGLRIFVCSLDPGGACCYAYNVDGCPHEETRKGACKEPYAAYWYAYHVDNFPYEETRKAAYRDPYYKQRYIETFGE